MAGISIHPAVLDLIKNKASVNEIIAVFEAHHQDENLDMQILLCYAVHYQHEDLLSEQRCFAYSEYSPFTTAVYDQNETMVKILMKKGITRNGARDFDDEKYGKIVNSQILTGDKTTVWDIIFERDDIRMFRCLQDHYNCFFNDAQEFPLLCMAKRYDAKECIQFIQNYPYKNTPWCPLGFPWNTKGFPWDTIDFPWHTMGVTLCTMGHHGVSIEPHGISMAHHGT